MDPPVCRTRRLLRDRRQHRRGSFRPAFGRARNIRPRRHVRWPRCASVAGAGGAAVPWGAGRWKKPRARRGEPSAGRLMTDAATLNDRGNLLLERGDVAGAIDCYRPALALAPEHPEIHFNLANALAETEEKLTAQA